MATKRVNKTVSFFEITDENEEPLAVVPWQDILEDLEREPPADRGHSVRGSIHYAQVYLWEEDRHLVLARHRSDSPSTFDLSTGNFIDSETQAGRPWVELSVVSFIPGTNRIGFVLGGQSSPRVGSFEDWLNEHEIFEEPIKLSAVTNAEVLERLEGTNTTVKMVRFRVVPDGSASDVISEGLYSKSREFSREVGESFEVDISIRVPGRTRSASVEALRQLGQYAKDLLGKDVTKAVAELVQTEDDGTFRSEMLDISKHTLTRSEVVSVLDAEGNSIRIPSAITAIRRAVARLGALLTN